MKILKKAVYLLPLLALTVCGSAYGQDKRDTGKDQKGALSAQDAKHFESIARANMAEVAAGKLAVSKAHSGDVKKFGQHMVDEHTKMVDEGGTLAKSKGVEPPAGPDKKHEAALKKLEGLSGENFDRAFMTQMVNDHREALQLVKETASKASDPDLKAMAQKAAPKVEEHLKMAEQISSKANAK